MKKDPGSLEASPFSKPRECAQGTLREPQVQASFLQLYLNHITDLLASRSGVKFCMWRKNRGVSLLSIEGLSSQCQRGFIGPERIGLELTLE